MKYGEWKDDRLNRVAVALALRLGHTMRILSPPQAAPNTVSIAKEVLLEADRGVAVFPWFTTDEDGETAFADGHIEPPERAVRCLIASAVYDGWDTDFDRLDRKVMEDRIEYVWWRERFPDDEVGERCSSEAQGAEAVTVLRDLHGCESDCRVSDA